jgi:membrane protein required for colicin V production
MNLLDVIIAVIILFCLIRGIFRGLIKEIASIIGVLVGFYAGYTYYPLVTKYLKTWINPSAYLNIIAFLLLFCSIFILISILGVIIKYLLNIAFLGWLDRVGGALFGALKGVLIFSVLLLTLTAFLPKGAALIRDSRLAPYGSVVSEQMAKMVSYDMKSQFIEKSKELKKNWNQN